MVFLSNYLSFSKMYFKNHFKYMGTGISIILVLYIYLAYFAIYLAYIAFMSIYLSVCHYLPVQTHHNNYRLTFSNFFGKSKEK